jgi:hypothetical protein
MRLEMTTGAWQEFGRRALIAIAVALVPVFAFGHGEQVLVFPISLALLIGPALVVTGVRWHRWWARLAVAVILLGSNVALWFVPMWPRTVGEMAAVDMRTATAILVIVPGAVAFVVALILRRTVTRSAA